MGHGSVSLNILENPEQWALLFCFRNEVNMSMREKRNVWSLHIKNKNSHRESLIKLHRVR